MQYIVTQAQLARLADEMREQGKRFAVGLEQIKTVVGGLGRSVGRLEWELHGIGRELWEARRAEGQRQAEEELTAV